jgi:signal transduction histidine kinase/pSer/pThr/pTyr-binding forkhead associated (FHA) protein
MPDLPVRPCLLVLAGPAAPRRVELVNLPFTIGRAEENSLSIKDQLVSRKHAELIGLPDGGLLFRDLRSRSGSFINGERVIEKRLAEGDEIVLGDGSVARLLYVAGSTMRPFVMMFEPDGTSQRFELVDSLFTVGRSPDCSLQIKDIAISRHHAEIRRATDGAFHVRDLDSASGTFVNGSRITGKPLVTGDEIVLANPNVARLKFFDAGALVRASTPPAMKAAETSPDDHDELVGSTTILITDQQTRFLNAELMRQPEYVSDQTLQRLSALYQMSHKLLPARDVNELAGIWLASLFDALPLDYGVILVVNPETGQLEPVASCGEAAEASNWSKSLAQRVFSENVAYLSDDAVADTRFSESQSVMINQIRSVLVAPIASRQRVWGVCYLGSNRRAALFKSEDLEFLMATSREAGLVIENLNLVRELRAMQDQLVKADRMATLGKMCSSISHELRNRLALISGIEIIEMKYPHDPEVRQFSQMAITGQRRALELVEEIRSFAKSTPTKFTMETRQLLPTLERTLSILRVDTAIIRRQLMLHPTANPYAVINEGKIEQVIINLIRNAVEATVEGSGQIVVSVGIEHGMASIRVSDNGHGIPADVLPRIWEPFFTTKGDDGTGLGLEICRRIVEAHHGRMTVTSRVGEGTCFTIYLPAATPPPDPKQIDLTGRI